VAISVLDSEGSNFKHNYVKTNECRPVLSAAKYRSITVVSDNINHRQKCTPMTVVSKSIRYMYMRILAGVLLGGDLK